MAKTDFRVSMVEDALDLGTGTSPKKTVDLPNSHPLSRVYVRQRATHATSIDITQDLIEVLVDGSPIVSGLTGADLSKITKFVSGRQFTLNPTAGTDVVIEQMIHFGRFGRDPLFALPAPLFSNVQLRVNSTLTATPTASELTVAVEEILAADLKRMVMRKWSLIGDEAAGASKQIDTKLPLGSRLAAVYVDYNDVDNVDGAPVQLGINNFSEIPWSARRVVIEAYNKQTYPFDDNDIPAVMFALDQDLLGAVEKAIDSRGGKGVSDLKLRVKGAASGTAGNIRVIAEEYIPVSVA